MLPSLLTVCVRVTELSLITRGVYYFNFLSVFLIFLQKASENMHWVYCHFFVAHFMNCVFLGSVSVYVFGYSDG